MNVVLNFAASLQNIRAVDCILTARRLRQLAKDLLRPQALARPRIDLDQFGTTKLTALANRTFRSGLSRVLNNSDVLSAVDLDFFARHIARRVRT